jgi:hypothetical protein
MPYVAGHWSILDVVISSFARAAIASAFRLAYQAGQQRECSQACPVGVAPTGSSTS